MTEEGDGPPLVDAVVLDTARNRVGRVMGSEGPYLQLRPLGGGREWDVTAAQLHRLTGAELLSTLVAEANARSRRNGGNGPPLGLAPGETEGPPPPGGGPV
ncbi:hypothetical protein ACIRQY_12635 [Streptomyces sp. NPDC101490]|uniref:hypothetical protein n=1 Tax=Streptomyces sp. NPDC101490 TaxID=3366143 RepID=UPI00380CFC0A